MFPEKQRSTLLHANQFSGAISSRALGSGQPTKSFTSQRQSADHEQLGQGLGIMACACVCMRINRLLAMETLLSFLLRDLHDEGLPCHPNVRVNDMYTAKSAWWQNTC